MNRVERLAAIARKKSRVIVGLMSGTSTDAIDAVLVRISGSARQRAKIEIIRFASFPCRPSIKIASSAMSSRS